MLADTATDYGHEPHLAGSLFSELLLHLADTKVSVIFYRDFTLQYAIVILGVCINTNPYAPPALV
jgi:hypothetical protein